ncbi:MAG: hypothetical protein L6Q75_18695, partial [Burkholderiaceae bacterium]|nr:hypothetical protein [Burkholderiaceae bacterium]
SRAPDGPRLPPQALPTLVARLAGPDAPAALPTALLRRLAGQAPHPVSGATPGGSSAAPDPVAPRPAAAGGAPGARDLAALAAALDPTRRPPPAAATALADPTSEPAGRTARRAPLLPGEAPPAAAPVAWPAAPPPGGRPSALVELLQRWPGAQAGPGQPLASAGAPLASAAVGNAVGDAVGPSPLDRFADPPGLRGAASLSPPPTPIEAAGRHMAVEAAARPRHDDPADGEAAGGDELLFRRRLERVLQAELRRHGIDPGEGG